MTIMTTRRSIDGGMNRLAAGVLVAALLGSTACVPATAVAQGQAPAMKTPAAAAPVAAPAASPAVQPDPAILLERARKKIKVDHDVAGAVAAYREVIEKHRADLAHARPALRELLDLWVEVQGNEAAAAAIRPAAEKYLDMQRPIDPKAAAARTDDDLARDLLLKPWLVTLKFDKAPLKEVLAEITRQSGVAIELGTVPLPFDAAKYRAFMKKLPRYAELPDEERKAMQAEALVMDPKVADAGDMDQFLRQAAAHMHEITAGILEMMLEQKSMLHIEQQEANAQLSRSEVTLDVKDVTAFNALDIVGAASQPPIGWSVAPDRDQAAWASDSRVLAMPVVPPVGRVVSPSGGDTVLVPKRTYQGRSSIQLTSQRTGFLDAKEARVSRLQIDVSFTREPGPALQEMHLRAAVGTDGRGRKFDMEERTSLMFAPQFQMFFKDVPAEVQEFATLTVELSGIVVAESKEQRLPLAKGNCFETPRYTLMVRSIDKAGGETGVTLNKKLKDMGTTNAQAPARVDLIGLYRGDDGPFGAFQLELANGERIRAQGMSGQGMSGGGDGGGSQWRLDFATGSAEPTALIWAVPTKEIAVTIPFEFKNVKLP
jgi:hypothetical protein